VYCGGVSSENHFLNRYTWFDKVRQQNPYNEAGNGGGNYPPPHAGSTGFFRYSNRVLGGYGVDGPSLSEGKSFEKCGRMAFHPPASYEEGPISAAAAFAAVSL
jgi:hypothetical protein